MAKAVPNKDICFIKAVRHMAYLVPPPKKNTIRVDC